MNKAERLTAYRAALNSGDQTDEAGVAQICAGLPPRFSHRPDDAWEGALLAGVTPAQLGALVEAGDWPAIAALAGLAGEDPSSLVIRFNRDRWARWSPPEPAARQAGGSPA